MASNLNYTTATTVANQVIAKLGTGGRLTLFSLSATDLVLDVSGYYPTAARYVALQPLRVLDTRTGLGAPKARVRAGGTATVQVTGHGGVPTTGVAAVVLNVTAVVTSTSGYATVFPSGQPRPTTSNLNYSAGGTVPALAIAKLDPQGRVSIFTSAASDLLADVAGYIPAGSDYSALPIPERIADTRTGLGAKRARIPAGGTLTITVAGAGGIPPDGAQAVFLNVTAVNPSLGGHLTVYPTGSARPTASVVNYTPKQNRANSFFARLGTGGRVSIYSRSETDVVVDVAGYAASPLIVTMTQPATTAVIPETSTISVIPPADLGEVGSITTTEKVPDPGGYVYLPPGGANGDGALGKVTSRSTTDGVTTASLVAVPLEEAFPAGHIEGTAPATDPLVAALDGQSSDPVSTKTAAAGPIGPKCSDSGITTEVTMRLEFGQRIRILADWGAGKRTHLRVTVTASVTAEAAVALKASVECSWSVEFPVGAIGPFIPTVSWDMKMEMSGEIKSGARWTSTSTDGFDWWYGDSPTRIHSGTKSVTWTPPNAATGKVRFSVGPTVALQLAKLAGPYVGAAAYVEVVADPSEDPWWLVNFGVEAKAGVRIDVLFLVHADYSLAWAKVYSVQVGRASGPYPGYIPLAAMTTSLPGGQVGTPYSTQLTATGGTSPYTWTRTSGLLPDGLNLSGSGVITGIPTAAGTASVQFTVTDAGGRTATTGILGLAISASPTAATSTISVAGGQSCALTSSGAVMCWGANASGQLGNGTLTSSPVPVQVSGLSAGVKGLSAGASHVCALTGEGAVKCWGANFDGQLGDGTTKDSITPVQVVGLTSGVTSISAGDTHTCALAAGTVVCWGSDSTGQLGNDSSFVSSSVPVAAVGLPSGVASISAGRDHSCAVTNAGAAYCWGSNQYGQIGIDTATWWSLPTPVTGLTSGVTSVSAGMSHTCAVVEGAALCWGSNTWWQLGDGSGNASWQPVQVSGLVSNVSAVSAGAGHSCAVFGGSVKCWGLNDHGEVGNGTTMPATTPTQVTNLTSGAIDVSVGTHHICAVSEGGATCWGANSAGQLGNGTTIDSLVPVGVSGL